LPPTQRKKRLTHPSTSQRQGPKWISREKVECGFKIFARGANFPRRHPTCAKTSAAKTPLHHLGRGLPSEVKSRKVSDPRLSETGFSKSLPRHAHGTNCASQDASLYVLKICGEDTASPLGPGIPSEVQLREVSDPTLSETAFNQRGCASQDASLYVPEICGEATVSPLGHGHPSEAKFRNVSDPRRSETVFSGSRTVPGQAETRTQLPIAPSFGLFFKYQSTNPRAHLKKKVFARASRQATTLSSAGRWPARICIRPPCKRLPGPTIPCTLLPGPTIPNRNCASHVVSWETLAWRWAHAIKHLTSRGGGLTRLWIFIHVLTGQHSVTCTDTWMGS